MLQIELDEFIGNLNVLDKFIKTYISKADVVLPSLSSESSNSQISEKTLFELVSAYEEMRGYRKKFNYSAIVILLYGYFENFIESITKQYVKVIASKTHKFEQLPHKIRENHFAKSIELSKKLNLDKYKKSITQEQIVANLFSCQNENPQEFTLNVEAYSMHTANFRSEIINAVFADIGVVKINEKIIKDQIFSEYLKNEMLGSIQESQNDFFIKAAKSKVEELLSDLAQRRNEIAHGAQVNDILSPEILQEKYIVFLKKYAQSLKNKLQEEIDLFQESLLVKEVKSYTRIGSPIQTWQNDYIAGFTGVFTPMRLKIQIGDELIRETVQRGTKKYKKIKVLEIHIQKKNCESVELFSSPQEFTLKLNEKAKKNHVIFAKNPETL